jgi:hypothetical protein
MMTASAPAFCAFSALTPKVHVPRWMSAMSFGPAKAAASKSDASQPLVEPGVAAAGITTSTLTTLPVTLPAPE